MAKLQCPVIRCRFQLISVTSALEIQAYVFTFFAHIYAHMPSVENRDDAYDDDDDNVYR